VELIERGLHNHTHDYAAWMILGHARARLRQFDKAESCYFVCQTLRPKSAHPVFYLGLVHMDQGRLADAEADFSQCLELEPDQPIALANRALCRQMLRRLDEAAADCDRAIEMGLTQTRIYFVRSRIRRMLGNAAGADDDFATGLALPPTDEASWAARGFAKVESDPRGAVEDFAQAIRLNPDSATALESSAAIYYDKLGQPQQALECMNQLVEADPGNARHLANRGILYARTGNLQAALADVQAALKSSQSADTFYRAAGLFSQLSSAKEEFAAQAVQLLRTAAFKDPSLVLKYLNAGDSDLEPLKESDDFQALVDHIRALQETPSNATH
jgi:tetratricopeptide (TPR) repeat protein